MISDQFVLAVLPEKIKEATASTTIDKKGAIQSPADRLMKLYSVPDPFISNFVSSIPRTFSQLVGALLSSAAIAANTSSSASNNTIGDAQIVNNRTILARYIRKFHSDAGTFSSSVEENMSFLDDPSTIVLASSHQPNLFPYAGVVKKIVMIEAIRDSLLKQIGQASRKVINLFVIIDQEFADDKWICHAELPSINHEKGILRLSHQLASSDRRRMVRNVRKPAQSVLARWKKQVTSWVFDNTRAISNNKSSSIASVLRTDLRKSEYYNNFEIFWTEVEDAYSRSESLSDFNAFLLSQVVNKVFGYGTLFVRLTEMPVALQDGIKYLIANLDKYSRLLEGTENILTRHGIYTRVSQKVSKSAPVWLHCQCGSKASVGLNHDGTDLILAGSCIGCSKQIERSLGQADDPDLSQTITNLSLRAIPIPLLLSRDLGATCYVTGTGGLGYLIDAAAVGRGLSMPFPVIALWEGRDLYDGIGQRAALKLLNIQETSQLRHHTEKLQRDYAVHADNIGQIISQRSSRIKAGLPIDDLLRDLIRLKEQQRNLRCDLKQAQRARGATSLSPCLIDYVVNFGMMRLPTQWDHYLKRDGDLVKSVRMGILPQKDAGSTGKRNDARAASVA